MIEKNSISLLLGAGASIKQGGPTMDTLTKFVFEEPPEGYIYNSSIKRYELNQPEYRSFIQNTMKYFTTYGNFKISLRDVYTFINEMIKIIYEFSSQTDFKESVNHEHFLGALNFYKDKIRLKSTLIGFEEIEIIRKLIREIFNDVNNKLILAVLDKTEDIIIARILLYFDLNMNEYEKESLMIIEELTKSKLCNNIITLNYDLMIEELLNSLSIPVNDGFECKTNFVDEFHTFSYSFKYKKDHLSLFKLHGSFNYMTYFHPREENNTHKVYHTEIVKFDISNIESILNTFDTSQTHRQLFSFANLTVDGYSKEKSYFSIYTFRRIIDSYIELQKSNVLLAIGYSFGDFGINSIVLNWLNLNSKNQLFIIDPYLDFNYGTLATWSKSENLENRIHLINRKVENVSYNDLINFIKEKKRDL